MTDILRTPSDLYNLALDWHMPEKKNRAVPEKNDPSPGTENPQTEVKNGENGGEKSTSSSA